jgi:thiamine biosynthesis protein ThiS
MPGEVFIEVLINGTSCRVPAGLSVASLLAHLEIDPVKVAVELDRRIVKIAEWGRTSVPAGAEIEIVHFVGGG